MSASKIFAQIVAMVGGATVYYRHRADGVLPQAIGSTPAIPKARPQGIPTLKMPTARGWSGGKTPVAAPVSRSTPLRQA